MPGLRIAADFPNLAETRTALNAAADGLGRGLDDAITHDAQPILATTRALTPLGPGPRAGVEGDLPHIRDTYAIVVAGGSISLISQHPGAVVHEYGGTIRPRGVPITFREQAMARRAAVQHLPEIERAIDERINRLL